MYSNAGGEGFVGFRTSEDRDVKLCIEESFDNGRAEVASTLKIVVRYAGKRERRGQNLHRELLRF